MFMRFIARACLAVGLFVLPLSATAFEPGDPAKLGFDPAKLAMIPAMLDADAASGNIPGSAIMILKDGKLALTHTSGVRGPGGAAQELDDIFRIYSMTKPLVSAAALLLVDRGKLDLDAPVSAYIPEFANQQVAMADGLVPADSEMTVRDLMRHTSGMTYGFFGNGPARTAYNQHNLFDGSKSTQDMARLLASLPLEHHPGTYWEYSHSIDVLGAVIEVASGTLLDAFLEAEIFEPLGMEDTSFSVPADKVNRIALPAARRLFNPADQTRYFQGGGGLVSTAPDYLNFAAMILSGGEWNGERLLSEESFALMSTDQLDGMRPGNYDLLTDANGFGLGLAVRVRKNGPMLGEVGDLFWSGYAGTYFWVDPVNDMAVVFMIQNPAKSFYYRAALRKLVYDALDGS